MKDKTEERLLKGCGITLETWSWGNNYFVKEEDLDNDFCGEECRNPHNKSRLGKVQYCDVCQAKLEQHRQTKAEYGKILYNHYFGKFKEPMIVEMKDYENTKADCRDKFKAWIKDRIALQKMLKMSCDWEDTITKKEANDLIIKSFEELLQKADEMFKEEEKQDE